MNKRITLLNKTIKNLKKKPTTKMTLKHTAVRLLLRFIPLWIIFSLTLAPTSTAYTGTPTSANCSVFFFQQDIDHFNWGPLPLGRTSFPQRYFICNQFWVQGGLVFFYFGNEDDVTLYINHTGLMWENAPRFHALLVFAEHRYVFLNWL